MRYVLAKIYNTVWHAILLVRESLWRSSLKSVEESNGQRFTEHRIKVLGIELVTGRKIRNTYRIGLLVDEFFGAWGTAIGGYGALARKYICRLIPNEKFQIDVLLDSSAGRRVQHKQVDGTNLYKLPGNSKIRRRWLDSQDYDVFLSIEMTAPSFEILREYGSGKPILYWIQDPRHLDMYQPRLRTVQLIRDGDWSYIKEVAPWVRRMIEEQRIHFISQGKSLSKIAKEMYQIPQSTPIYDLPNPIEIEISYRLDENQKNNSIIFLGRLEAQKRVWIFCEIAKLMPQFQFYVLGTTGKGRDEAANAKTLEPYRNADGTPKVANLHFAGHVDGELKKSYLRNAKLLVNTSIWEGIPVSWLEALSYGTLIVSAFDRDDIVTRYGTFVGEIMGDGINPEDLRKFSAAIEFWISEDDHRNAVARKAIEFVRSRHSEEAFTQNMRAALICAARQDKIAPMINECVSR